MRHAKLLGKLAGRGAATESSRGGGGLSCGESSGFEACAMEKEFYQRDVAAEYEALDYGVSSGGDSVDSTPSWAGLHSVGPTRFHGDLPRVV